MSKNEATNVLSREFRCEWRSVHALKPNPHNPRVHPKQQIRELAENILTLGFTCPIVIDEHGVVLAGHARLEAAKLVGLDLVPVIVIEGLSPGQKRALLLADNRIAAKAKWNQQLLSLELKDLQQILAAEGLDIALTGFKPIEINKPQLVLQKNWAAIDQLKPEWLAEFPVTRPHDLWQLSDHRICCGDARDPGSLSKLMREDRAAMAFLDPPAYSETSEGAPVEATVEPAIATMCSANGVEFLQASLRLAAANSKQDAVHFVSTDWRNIQHLIEAGGQVYHAMLNLIVWVKDKAEKGWWYDNHHELFAVYCVENHPRFANAQVNRKRHSRSNVWRYTSPRFSWAAGPIPKPAAMLADAIRDWTQPNDVVLDTFAGTGTTLLAAESVGRRGYLLDIEPRSVDFAVRRWQVFTGKEAVHAITGRTFNQAAAKRAVPVDTSSFERHAGALS